MDTNSKYTGLLYNQPSFIEGMARILDFGDTLTEYNRSQDPDTIALRADWNAVAQDLVKAIETGCSDRKVSDLQLKEWTSRSR